MRTNGFRMTHVSLKFRIKFLDSVVSSVVRFGVGQRKLYNSELGKFDVHCCRKLLCQAVGHRGNIFVWHQWSQSVVEQMQLNGVELWLKRRRSVAAVHGNF